MAEEKKTVVVFDGEREINVKLQSPDGTTRPVAIRFPSDEEWMDRQRRRKVIIKSLGRGMSETVPPETADDDAQLLKRLLVEEGPEVDGYEATRILDQLADCDVDDVQAEGGAYRVTTRVLGGMTAHLLRMPTAKEILHYRRGFVRVIDLPYNRQSVTINMTAAGDLYRDLRQKAEGYAGDAVPIVHQAIVVKAVIDAVEAACGVAGTENF
jgi:hypothetical protein